MTCKLRHLKCLVSIQRRSTHDL